MVSAGAIVAANRGKAGHLGHPSCRGLTLTELLLGFGACPFLTAVPDPPSFRREPQGVLLRAGCGAQRHAGGRGAQAGLHRRLPLRQRLHAGGRPDPDLHHGRRQQAELEQAQTRLHR